jgi:pimeloyl-ACP methyl ester carboxylesterase
MKKMTTLDTEPAPAGVSEAFVRSADGTRIGFRRLGSGPAIVMVHGCVSTHTAWTRAAKLLSGRYTCFAMDRRGRSHSGVGRSPYRIEREYEDVCAVLDAAGPGATLAGHSFGAICAMGAALLHPVQKLVLYEPPFPVGGPVAGAHFGAYARAVADGDMETAIEIGMSKFTRLSAAAIAAMRTTKAWLRLHTLAPSWTRELVALDSLPVSLDDYRALACPTLLLQGSLSPEHPLKNATREVARVLPNVRVEMLVGHGHMALLDAPEMVARLIADFLGG